MPKQQWKGSTLLAPVPVVMVSCGTMEKPNIITIAWTGIVCSQPPMTYISIKPERYSYDIIKNSKQFVINLVSEDLARAADYCGVKSGRDTDKFEKCKLKAQKAFKIDCPAIAQSPICLECKVTDIVKLGSHDMFLAEIVSVDVDDYLLNKNDKLNIKKANLCTFAHGEYFKVGASIGTFGHTVRKKPLQKKR